MAEICATFGLHIQSQEAFMTVPDRIDKSTMTKAPLARVGELVSEPG